MAVPTPVQPVSQWKSWSSFAGNLLPVHHTAQSLPLKKHCEGTHVWHDDEVKVEMCQWMLHTLSPIFCPWESNSWSITGTNVSVEMADLSFIACFAGYVRVINMSVSHPQMLLCNIHYDSLYVLLCTTSCYCNTYCKENNPHCR